MLALLYSCVLLVYFLACFRASVAFIDGMRSVFGVALDVHF